MKKLIHNFVYLLSKCHRKRSLVHDYHPFHAQELKSSFAEMKSEVSDVCKIVKATEEDVDRQVESDLVGV